MIKIIHRVNKIEELKKIPKEFGVEVDIRSLNNKLILNHEPFGDGDLLDDYLANFNHAFIVLEIKEEGIEQKVIELCKKHNIENYFLLSVTFPFIYLLSKEGIRKTALRFSEFESVDSCLALKGLVDWVWVDTFNKNPLNVEIYNKLKEAGFKLCLVSPDRWGRPEENKSINDFFKQNNIILDAIMVGNENKDDWN